MTLKVYSIRDTKTEVYNVPFFQKTDMEAQRSFSRVLDDSQGLMAHFPDDFDLYYLGEFDDQKGVMIALETPKHIVKGTQLIKNQPQPNTGGPQVAALPGASQGPQIQRQQ